MESVAEELEACVLACGFCFTCTGYIQQICLFESDVAFGKSRLHFRWPTLKKNKIKKAVAMYVKSDLI